MICQASASSTPQTIDECRTACACRPTHLAHAAAAGPAGGGYHIKCQSHAAQGGAAPALLPPGLWLCCHAGGSVPKLSPRSLSNALCSTTGPCSTAPFVFLTGIRTLHAFCHLCSVFVPFSPGCIHVVNLQKCSRSGGKWLSDTRKFQRPAKGLLHA